ncbi:DUF4235 domain-containing protein [Streptomyces sp. NPDC089799]|uniref:DUF4235 domain-containing protein n=1 Tax=Streptomyces sp. NPDC089799 TaxID=3155066 RepID=UPI00342F8B5A
MKASRIAYKPVGLTLGAVGGLAAGAASPPGRPRRRGGLAAGAAFRQVWKVIGHDDAAPGATDEDRTWREVLLAAALHGATFALVRAAVERAGATATRRLTGTWPG